MYIALNEVYFGKTKNLIEVEKLLGDIKKEYDGKYYRAAKIVTDRRWSQLQELLANEFGLKRFIITIEPVAVENAYTLPISWGIDVAPTFRTRANLICDENSFKFKREARYIIGVTIFSGLLLNPLFSAGEVLATIIHEVGHNFESVIDERCFLLTDITHITVLINNIIVSIMQGDMTGAISASLTPIVASNKYKDISAIIGDTLMKSELVRIVYYIGSCVCGVCKSFQYGFLQLLGGVLGYTALINPAIIIAELIKGVMSLILNPLGYRGEKIADNFATVYGYGPELSSALMKLEMDTGSNLPMYGTAKSIPFIGQFIRGGVGVSMMVGSLFDPHPNTVERCLDQVRYLKKELPLMSKEDKILITRQINEIENNLESIMKDPKLDDHWNGFSYFTCAVVYSNGGDTKGKVLGRGIPDAIQKTYDIKIGYKEPKRVSVPKPKLI